MSFEEIKSLWEFVSAQDNKENPLYKLSTGISSGIGRTIEVEKVTSKSQYKRLSTYITDYSKW